VLKRLAYRLRGPFLAAVTDAALERHGPLPRPSSAPNVHAMGSNPDRLLLLGTAAASSVGVASHELGLGGQLARRISALTGRGVDMDVLGRQNLTVADTIDMLGSLDLARYDAVILMLGAREASGMQPVSLWSRGLDRLFATLAELAPASLHTFMVQILDVPQFVDLPAVLAGRVTRQIVRLNASTQSASRARTRTSFVPFAPKRTARIPSAGAVATFESWAELLAPHIAFGLQQLDIQPHPVEIVDEGGRQRALDDLGIVGTPADERYDRIVRMARAAFGVPGAAINFIDRGRQWTKAAAPMNLADVERMHAFCSTTVDRAELFVVEDASKNSDFAGFPSVTGPGHLRFYAGYPLEAPDGHRVGALCVVDTEPRQFSNADAAMLRELALRAQQLLWDEAPVPTPTRRGPGR